MDTKQKLHLGLTLLIGFCLNSLRAQPPAQDLNWEIVPAKSDDFNNLNLGSIWQRISGPNWGISTFDPNFVSLDGTSLNLKVDQSGGNYVTGGIRTNLFNYQYGYYEIEALLPYGKGLWPCFWVWGADGANSYTELDILEPAGCQFQYADRNVFGFWYKPNPPCFGGGCDVKVEFDKQNITNMSVFTHKYAVEWHPGQVIFYLDDVPVGSAYNDPRVPFNPSQVVIDMQVDGGACAPNSATLFPQKMKVNYFKYYRLKTQCNSNVVINNNNFDFNNPVNFSVKKTYSITNTTIATSANVALRATDYINLGSGFEVPIGASFSALTTPCY